MDKTIAEKVELGVKVSQKMIADMEGKLADAIRREDWNRAADLKSYISGMSQILIVFEQAAN